MNWEEIPGHNSLKMYLKNSILENRVSHAQLFLGKEGYGVLPIALAYSKEILNEENNSAAHKVETLNHLDLHFSFPVYSEKNNSLSSRFYNIFREMILENPYVSFDDWTSILESENKQLFISAEEIEEQNKKFTLKSFEGGTKILIIWRADKMNVSAANKLLKFLEEPPEKTLIILTAEDTKDILPTILSRTQLVEISRFSDEEIIEYLYQNNEVSIEKATKIAIQAQGDLSLAIKYSKNQVTNEFELLFIQWVRDAFQVKKKPEYLKSIIRWAREIASWNREKQKNFLQYCLEMFRMALLQNFSATDIVYKKIEIENFNWVSFSKFIHGANIENILDEISTADHHLQRNANAKIVWTDLGIKLSRYIHIKP